MAVSRPTLDDFIGWLKLQSNPDDAAMAVYTEAFNAALDDIESRIEPTFVVAAGYSLVEADDNYPPKVRLAILLGTSRLAKRSTTPEGYAGSAADGVMVRILSNDSDIERLIGRYKNSVLGFA